MINEGHAHLSAFYAPGRRGAGWGILELPRTALAGPLPAREVHEPSVRYGALVGEPLAVKVVGRRPFVPGARKRESHQEDERCDKSHQKDQGGEGSADPTQERRQNGAQYGTR
jgi:hypothetical protein